MNDLISRQAAIDQIECLMDDKTKVHYNHGCADAIATLNNLPSAQQCIPVEERLPEFDELVLVWVENKDPKGRFNKPGIHTAQLRKKEPKHDPEGRRNIWGIPGYDSEWTVWAWSYFSEPAVKAWIPGADIWDPYAQLYVYSWMMSGYLAAAGGNVGLALSMYYLGANEWSDEYVNHVMAWMDCLEVR